MAVKSVSHVNIFERLARICVQALVFLVPIFFLPWGSVSLGLSKSILITIVVFIAFIVWMTGQVVHGTLSFKKDRFWYVCVGVILFSGISALFSDIPTVSLWGSGGEVDVFFITLAFGLLSFLIVHAFRSSAELMRLGILALISSGVTLVYAVLQVFGWWILPWEFTRSVSYNTIGTTNALALYGGIVLIALMSYCATYRSRTDWRYFSLLTISFILFGFLYVLGYWDVFILITLVGAVLLVMGVRSLNIFWISRFFIILLILLSLVISITYVAGFDPRLSIVSLPPQVRPNLSSSMRVVGGTYSEGLTSALIGSGPGTFGFQHSLYKDVSLNQTFFWGVHFTQGANAFVTTLIHWGIVGTLLFLLLVGWLVVRGWRTMTKYDYSSLSVGLFLTLIYVVGSLFVYHQNITIYFLIFAIGGMIMSLSLLRQRLFFVSMTRWWGYIIVVFVGLFLLWCSFTYGMSYVSAWTFQEGVRASDRNDLDSAIAFIERAIMYNPRNEVYYRTLSTAYLLKARSLVTLDEGESAQDELSRFSDVLASAVSTAQKALDLNDRNVDNYLALAKVYENVIPFVDKSLDEAIRYYLLAHDREPNNPTVYANMGRSYVTWAEVLARRKSSPSEVEAAYEKAVEYYRQAIQLKKDYFPAHLQLVQLLDGLGRDQEAADNLLFMRTLSPADPQLFFQIGLLHYRAGRLGQAREDIEKALALSSSYANARYFLGLIYDREGSRDKAFEQFGIILKTNPNNQEVQSIIENLRRGKPALSGIVQ